MNDNTIAAAFIKEMQDEYTSTKKCLERIPESTYDFQPHPKSMKMGYLTLLVAEIPLWIKDTIGVGIIDLGNYKHFELSTTEKLLAHFEENFTGAIEALKNMTTGELEETFSLKNNGELLFSNSKKDNIGSSINHWVHHRGQLTVYMRLNDIAVPSIYGPSADEKGF